MRFESEIEGEIFEVELNDELTEVQVNGSRSTVEIITQASGRILLRKGTKVYKIDNIDIDGRKVSFSLNGSYFETIVKNEQELLLEKLGFQADAVAREGQLKAPMPGKILELLVQEGDNVEENQPILILEAMKMENELKSPANGIISELHIQQGDSVEKNQKLLDIEPSG